MNPLMTFIILLGLVALSISVESQSFLVLLSLSKALIIGFYFMELKEAHVFWILLFAALLGLPSFVLIAI